MGSDTLGSPKALHGAQEVLRLDKRERLGTVLLGRQSIRDLPPEAGEHAGEQTPVGATRDRNQLTCTANINAF